MSCKTQLIDGNGNFNATGLDTLVKQVKLAECGLHYAVVAIMGPQSSGKSTLMNHLFQTNFEEMNAYDGRKQTTKGIWLANCGQIEPCTLAMDLEGTDGRERGEEDTVFESQSFLFALAISDIVLINMWCCEIGREKAANKPLLRRVFQVMMRIFTPRKTTLLFVIRDKSTKTPLKMLMSVLMEDMKKIWDEVPKPQGHQSTLLSDIFNVEAVALSSYEHQEDKFHEDVAQLRQRFSNSISPGGLADDRRGVVPGSAFSLSAQKIWKVIKENENLNLPSHKVMVATVRCVEIATKKFSQLIQTKDWMELEVAAQTGPVSHFGQRLSSILGTFLSEYDMETMAFDEGVRISTRKQLLESRALDSIHAAYTSLLGHLYSQEFEEFKVTLENSLNKHENFDSSVTTSCIQSSMFKFLQTLEDATIEKASWESSSIRNKFQGDLDAHALYVHGVKLLELNAKYEEQIYMSLAKQMDSVFEDAVEDIWATLISILRDVENTVSTFSTVIVGFNLDKETSDKMEKDLRVYARNVMEGRVRDMTSKDKILSLMKHRFERVFFNHDADSKPWVWKKKKVMEAMKKDAYSASLKVLSAMAAMRFDDPKPNIEKRLFSSLMNKSKSSEKINDPLDNWDEVSPEDTLITPARCKLLWVDFIREIHPLVTQAATDLGADKWHIAGKVGLQILDAVASTAIGTAIGNTLSSPSSCE